MADYKKMTFGDFRKKLGKKGYANATAAKRALSKVKDLTAPERRHGLLLIGQHFKAPTRRVVKISPTRIADTPHRTKSRRIEWASLSPQQQAILILLLDEFGCSN